MTVNSEEQAKKLVSWHTDVYQKFSDDNCLICLTEKDIYLLGNALKQMRYSTRWIVAEGDMLPDIDAIASELESKLMNCTDFCAEIIVCINDSESGVANSIINITNNSDSIINVAQGQGTFPFGDGNNTGCSKDIWWGGIEHLVDSLDENNLDALQIFEVATNVTEWITDVVAGVFGIKAPIINSLLEWGLYIQDNILENYEAQITQQYKETLMCDLLCIAMENCELTPQQLVDYFFGRLSSQLTFHSLLTESLEFLVLGVWTGTEIADFMMLSQLVFRAQFGRWFQDVAFNSIDVDIRLGFDNASNDWELICDDCPTGDLFIVTFDVLSADNWTISDFEHPSLPLNPATIIQFTGFGNPQPSAKGGWFIPPIYGRWSGVRLEFTQAETITFLKFEYYWIFPESNVLARSIILFDSDDNVLDSVTTSANNGIKNTWTEYEFTGNVANVKYIQLHVARSHGQGTANQSSHNLYIDNVRFG